MKKRSLSSLLVFLLTFPSTQLHASHTGQTDRDIDEFTGDKLLIGRGLCQARMGKKDHVLINEYYTIDVDRHLYPCKVANGFSHATYINFPAQRFRTILFEHVSFTPVFYPDHFVLTGQPYLMTSSYGYKSWQKILEPSKTSILLPRELYRITKPNGNLIFKSLVLQSIEEFINLNLWSNPSKNELPIGLQVWRNHYTSAGFTNPQFNLYYHEIYKGYYIQMSVTKPEVAEVPFEFVRTDTVKLEL